MSDAQDNYEHSTPLPAYPWRQMVAWSMGLSLIVAVIVLFNLNERLPPKKDPTAANSEATDDSASFSGPSEKLKRTVVLPTLDSPVEAGKSAVWCATLPLAWQQLESDASKGPFDIEGAKDLCRSLRNSPDSGLD